MLATGTDPLDHGAIPPFDLAQIPSEMLALQPAGFLWAGIVLIIALPIGRVVVAGVGFLAVARPSDGADLAARAPGRARLDRGRHRTGGLTWTSSSSPSRSCVILAGAELFTNGIEWFGRKLNLAQGAVGSVLAAVGHRPARDDDPDHRHRLRRGRRGHGRRGRRGDPGRAVHALDAGDVRHRRGRHLLARAPRDRDAHGRGHDGARPRHPLLRGRLRAGHRRPRSCRPS